MEVILTAVLAAIEEEKDSPTTPRAIVMTKGASSRVDDIVAGRSGEGESPTTV